MKTALIDLSGIYWRMWHVGDGDGPSEARRKTLTFIRNLYTDYDSIKICIDSPPYNRCKIYPGYKAHRAEKDSAAIEELKATIAEILKDGWPVLSCKGEEADDVMGSYCAQLTDPDEVVDILSGDKDMLQVNVYNTAVRDPFKGVHRQAIEVLGVEPNQVPDYLALVGDLSDNIPGVPGIGSKTACALLSTFDSIEQILKAAKDEPEKFKKAKVRESLLENANRLHMSRELAQLNYNCDIVTEQQEAEIVDSIDTTEVATEVTTEVEAEQVTHIVKHAETEYRHSLEPVGLKEAWGVSKTLHDSGLYSGNFRNPASIFATIMRGRALGIDATTALDSINVIKGKPTMSAALIVGLVLNSGKAEYFDCIEQNDNQATWITKRKNSPNEIKRTFTIDEAAQLGLSGKDNYRKQPSVMLQWRGACALARMVYPDIVVGLYSFEEMEG